MTEQILQELKTLNSTAVEIRQATLSILARLDEIRDLKAAERDLHLGRLHDTAKNLVDLAKLEPTIRLIVQSDEP